MVYNTAVEDSFSITPTLTPHNSTFGVSYGMLINTLRPRQNGCHFAEDSFKCIFLNENFRISNKFSLNFVPKGPNNNKLALVQIMAWCRPGNKPLSEPMMVRSVTHICVVRIQWVKGIWEEINPIMARLDCITNSHHLSYTSENYTLNSNFLNLIYLSIINAAFSLSLNLRHLLP